ncbi:hypothetical protein JCM8097_004494 [Rhodosporidiobolus ruineniae]
MAPLSRAALLSLTALTLHYSVLSIVLHLSRTLPGRRYHASSAIFLTELGKILVSLLLVLWTGELRTAVRERLKLREVLRLRDEERAEEMREVERVRAAREDEERWIREIGVGRVERNGSGEGEGEKNGKEEAGRSEATVVPMTTVHRRTSSLAGSDSSAPLSPTRTGPGSSLTINVPLANKPKSSSLAATGAPSLAIIPATPVPDPSPTRFPDQSALYPERPLETRSADHGAAGVLDDLGSVEWWRCLWATVWGEGVWKLAVLAALFCFQGNAQYLASSHLSVPIFQLAYQLKIPATAMCSVILLNKALSRQQWASLFILTFGVGLVQLFSVTAATEPSDLEPPPPSSQPTERAALDALSPHSDAPPNQMLGLAAVIAACISSGFASTYFERILKVPSSSSSKSPSSPNPSHALSPTLPSTNQQPPLPDPTTIVPLGQPSLWIRNIQLSIFGLGVGLPIVLWEMRGCLGAMDYGYLAASADQGVEAAMEAMGWWDRAKWVAATAGGNFFDGFNAITWVVIALQLTGGLLSALVMKHADNLLKCFSTSLSILISVAASVLLFNFRVSLGIFLGACLVIGATFVYTSPSKDWRWRPSFSGTANGSNYSPIPQSR